MSRKTFLALGVGLLLGFGLTLSVGADDTALERPGYALTTLDGSGNVGRFSSVTIGTDGLALISSFDETNGDLKVVHCSDSACTSATLTTVDRAGNVGQYSSVTIGTDGLALISYYDATNGDLKVAHCSDLACTSATLTTLDGAANNVGAPSSMIMGPMAWASSAPSTRPTATSRWPTTPTSSAFLTIAAAEQLGITESHHSIMA